MSYEDLETLTSEIRERLGEESSALISEDLLNILSNYKSNLDRIVELEAENEKLKSDKEELLKTNGKLFQKIGFEKEKEAEEVKEENEEEKSTEEIIEELIDEKGEII